jgi:hypothetical protein
MEEGRPLAVLAREREDVKTEGRGERKDRWKMEDRSRWSLGRGKS